MQIRKIAFATTSAAAVAIRPSRETVRSVTHAGFVDLRMRNELILRSATAIFRTEFCASELS
jgi:hypothetical protein